MKVNDRAIERPILFSAQMVNAVLDGTKTMTRRVVKLKLNDDGHFLHAGNHDLAHKQIIEVREQNGRWFGLSGYTTLASAVCPYGKIGDRLWVRESWRTNSIYDNDKPSLIPDSAPIEYLANTISGDMAGKIRPSIFMPRWASRIDLEITGIRVERLQDISDENAKAEGIAPTPGRDIVDRWLVKNPKGSLSEYSSTQYPVDAYKSLWQSINGPCSWDANPWVWVIEFKHING